MTINVFFHVILGIKSIKNTFERIAKADRKMVNDIDYEGIELPVSKKDYSGPEQRNEICINAFCCENDLVYLFMYQIKSLKIV